MKEQGPETPAGGSGPGSRRMVFWMIAVPVVLLLLAVTGANWRIFHLSYCRHLLKSDDAGKRLEGLKGITRYHLGKGMNRETLAMTVSPLPLRPGPTAVRAYGISKMAMVGANPESSLLEWAHVEVATPSGNAFSVEVQFKKGLYATHRTTTATTTSSVARTKPLTQGK